MYVSIQDLDSVPVPCQKTNHFHLNCLRKLLKIRWQDKIPDTEVLKGSGMQNVHSFEACAAEVDWPCRMYGTNAYGLKYPYSPEHLFLRAFLSGAGVEMLGCVPGCALYHKLILGYIYTLFY